MGSFMPKAWSLRTSYATLGVDSIRLASWEDQSLLLYRFSRKSSGLISFGDL